MLFLVFKMMKLLKMPKEVTEVLLKLRSSRTSFEDTRLSSGKHFPKNQLIKSA